MGQWRQSRGLAGRRASLFLLRVVLAVIAMSPLQSAAEEPAPDSETLHRHPLRGIVLESALEPNAALSDGLQLESAPLSLGGSLSLDALDALEEVGEAESVSEYPCLGRCGVNLRLAGDLSSRTLYNDRTGLFFHATFIGVDVHKVFSGPEGDWGTAVLQPFLTRLDNFPAQPPFFDDGDDWEMVWRIFNFNYVLHPKGRLNFRIGHMEIPFGLEQVINTNGTLKDYIHGPNLGVKGDWGVSLNGELPDFEYEFALTRGSGNDWINRGDPYIIAGRIGTPREDAVSFGMSVYYGNVFNYAAPNDPVRRWRGGFDVIFGAGPFEVLGEVSAGETEGSDVINTIAEIGWTSSKRPLTIYNQIFAFNSDTGSTWDHSVINNLGFRWTPDNHWAISGQWRQDMATFGAARPQGVFALQFRYRT